MPQQANGDIIAFAIIGRAAIFIVADKVAIDALGTAVERFDRLLQRLVALVLLPEDAHVGTRARVFVDDAIVIARALVHHPAFGKGDGKAAIQVHIIAAVRAFIGLLAFERVGGCGIGGCGQFLLARHVGDRLGPAAGGKQEDGQAGDERGMFHPASKA